MYFNSWQILCVIIITTTFQLDAHLHSEFALSTYLYSWENIVRSWFYNDLDDNIFRKGWSITLPFICENIVLFPLPSPVSHCSLPLPLLSFDSYPSPTLPFKHTHKENKTSLGKYGISQSRITNLAGWLHPSKTQCISVYSSPCSKLGFERVKVLFCKV